MREKDITPEVIRLSKKIAELWRMEIVKGVWYIDDVDDTPFLAAGNYSPIFLPIPSISDCEQKLVELGYESINLLRRPFKLPWMIDVWDKESHDLDADTIKTGENEDETLHGALLSVLLKALSKEGK